MATTSSGNVAKTPAHHGRFEFKVFCDGVEIFESNDACNAIAFYNGLDADFERRNIDRTLEFVYNDRRISKETMDQLSSC